MPVHLNRHPRRRRFTQCFAVAVIAVAFSANAYAERWDLASPYPEGSYQTKNNRWFAEQVKKRTGGKLEIVVHGGASLYKLPQIKRAVQTKQIGMGELLLGVFANENPIHGVGMMPFLTRNMEDAKKLWKVQRPFVAKLFDKQGLKLLHGVAWPGQSIFTKKPINSFKDIKGTKFRVQNPTTAKLAGLMKVTGVRVETADIPQSFLTGIIDGMYTSNVTTANLKGWDYIKYTYETNAWIPKNVTFVNKAMFNSLDPKVQKILLATSADAEKRGWGLEASETKQKTSLLRKNGVKVVAPPKSLMVEFQSIGKQMVDEWKKSAGADGAKLIADYNKLRGVK